MIKHYIAVLAALSVLAGIHLTVLEKQASAGRAPMPESLQNLPEQIANYERYGSDQDVDERTKELLETSTILIRNYIGSDQWPLQLTIVYAGATRRSLHFPEVCLVGEGWEIREQVSTNIGFLFDAKRLVLVSGQQRQAVLYWFKTGEKLTGNYFVNAYYWASNQLAFGAPTSSMIKLTTLVGPGGEEEAFRILEDFAWKFHPVLMEYVP